MKSVSGEIKLDTLMELLKKKIEETTEYRNRPRSKIKSKIKVEFYEMLLMKPIILYVQNRTLVTNNSYDELEKFVLDVFYIEDIYTLILCMNLSIEEMKRLTVRWIICEAHIEIKKNRVFQQVPFIDYFFDRSQEVEFINKKCEKKVKQNRSGRLDYVRMDDMFLDQNKIDDLKTYFTKAGTYFYSNIFNVNPSGRKDTYAQHELKYYKSPSEIEIKKKDIEKAYNYQCPICKTENKVWLLGHEDSNVKKFLVLNENFIEFECNHEKTEHDGSAKFGFDPTKYGFMLQTNEQYNQAFLYLFYRARHADGYIEYLEENEIKRLSIENYNKMRSSK